MIIAILCVACVSMMALLNIESRLSDIELILNRIAQKLEEEKNDHES